MSKTFLSIYSLQIISSSLSIAAYVGAILLSAEYNSYLAIQLIYVLSALFDISWFFFGIEKFKTTVIRNMIIKVAATAAVFVFVRSRSDLPIYIVIMALSYLLSQLSLWPFLFKEITLCKINFSDVKKHIKPNLKLFIPVIAISLYNIMDKIMLGAMSTPEEVGYYSNAEKIIQIPVTIMGSLGAVMMPKISNLIANDNFKMAASYIHKSLIYAMFIALPIAGGLCITGFDFSMIFYGEQFAMTGILIQILAVVVIIKAWANIIRTQYLIPNERDRIYINSVCIGAIVNLALNILLIPPFKSIGACMGTIAAELIVMLYQTAKTKKELNLRSSTIQVVKFAIKVLVMMLLILPIQFIEMPRVLRLIASIVAGVIIFILINKKYIVKIVKSGDIVKNNWHKRQN
jgi:O-antigen/teichoic acid export membrane protein